MAKKAEVKPLFDLKADYDASLQRFIHEAGMLADAVHMTIEMGNLKSALSDALQERLRAFNAARFGDDA